MKRKARFQFKRYSTKNRRIHDFRGYAGKLYGTILKLEMHNGFTFFNRIKKYPIPFDKQFEKLQWFSITIELEMISM
jgi:hypothetical protein